LEQLRLQLKENEVEHDRAYGELEEDRDTLQQELATLRQTYNRKADSWIKEKLEVQRRVRELEDAIRNSAGSGWDTERER